MHSAHRVHWMRALEKSAALNAFGASHALGACIGCVGFAQTMHWVHVLCAPAESAALNTLEALDACVGCI